jgi:Transglycosylase SLT domain
VTRLWSRLGVRVVAVGLLAAGVGGGYYLGDDREVQEQGIEQQYADAAELAETQLLKERHAAHELENARRKSAEALAAKKAAQAAKAAAERARKAEEASRKKRAAEADAKKAEEEENNEPAKPYTGPIPASCNEFSGNRKIGCALMLDRGFKISQFPCLNKLWNRESGWNHKAYNESSGAYGIPQALPGSKMQSAGSDWKTNPATQIKWGLGYIKDRYGNPCNAWQHSEDAGWY